MSRASPHDYVGDLLPDQRLNEITRECSKSRVKLTIEMFVPPRHDVTVRRDFDAACDAWLAARAAGDADAKAKAKADILRLATDTSLQVRDADWLRDRDPYGESSLRKRLMDVARRAGGPKCGCGKCKGINLASVENRGLLDFDHAGKEKKRDAAGRLIQPCEVDKFGSRGELVDEWTACNAICAVGHRCNTQDEINAAKLARRAFAELSDGAVTTEQRADREAKVMFNNEVKRGIGACAYCGLRVIEGYESAFDLAHKMGYEFLKYRGAVGDGMAGLCANGARFSEEWLDAYFAELAMCIMLCANCHRKEDTNKAYERDVEERFARLAYLAVKLERLDAQRA